MRLAEKREDMTDEDASEGRVQEGSTDDPQISPAASLSASLIQRGKDGWRGVETAVRGVKAAPEGPEEPVGARAQQAVLEEKFAEPGSVSALPAIDRAEFQSVRESAAEWNLFRGPSTGFWDRFLKDVSIFTIFFAVLVFLILQIL